MLEWGFLFQKVKRGRKKWTKQNKNYTRGRAQCVQLGLGGACVREARGLSKVAYLVSFEVGSPAGGKAFLAAEAFHLASHTQGITLDPHFLAPGTHYLYI